MVWFSALLLGWSGSIILKPAVLGSPAQTVELSSPQNAPVAYATVSSSLGQDPEKKVPNKAKQNGYAQQGKKKNEKITVREFKLESLRRAGRYIIGKVVDENGKPLNGAFVAAKAPGKNPAYSSVSRNDGTFHVMAPIGPKYNLTIKIPNFKTFSVEID